jgi:hypothetical protein
MHPPCTILLAGALAVALTACGDTPKPADKPAEKTADKPADKPAADAPDFAGWDQPGKAKAWQGSWVVKENGTLQAWTISGDKVEVWDGKTDEKFTLKVEAPCRASFVNDKGMMYPRNFAVTDGKLRFRAGGAGYRRGGEAIYCDPAGDIYVVDAAGACTRWESDFNKFKKGPGECGIKKDAKGADVFWHKGANEGDFTIEGDAILSATSTDTEPAADHAAAKAARDAKAAA